MTTWWRLLGVILTWKGTNVRLSILSICSAALKIFPKPSTTILKDVSGPMKGVIFWSLTSSPRELTSAASASKVGASPHTSKMPLISRPAYQTTHSARPQRQVNEVSAWLLTAQRRKGIQQVLARWHCHHSGGLWDWHWWQRQTLLCTTDTRL